MAFDELKQDLMNAEADMRSYMKNSDEYLRLRVFKIVMHHVTGITQALLIGIGFLFAFIFFSFAACWALSEKLDSYISGFVIVGGFYLLIGMLLYAFRVQLNAPILKKFSTYYFE